MKTLTTIQYLRTGMLSVLLSSMAAFAQSPQATAAPGEGGAPPSQADQSFVTRAIQGGNAEVQLGQLAAQKSESNDVKEFGQKMVTDHTQLGNEMKAVAQRLNVAAPTGIPAMDKALYAKLKGLSGSEFDREYITAMVKDHQQDLKDFRSEADSTQNSDLKQAAQKGSAVISEHLSMIQQIAKQHNVDISGSGT